MNTTSPTETKDRLKTEVSGLISDLLVATYEARRELGPGSSLSYLMTTIEFNGPQEKDRLGAAITALDTFKQKVVELLLGCQSQEEMRIVCSEIDMLLFDESTGTGQDRPTITGLSEQQRHELIKDLLIETAFSSRKDLEPKNQSEAGPETTLIADEVSKKVKRVK